MLKTGTTRKQLKISRTAETFGRCARSRRVWDARRGSTRQDVLNHLSDYTRLYLRFKMECLKKLLLFIVVAAAAADFTANCPEKCKCVWAGGNKQAVCSNAGLRDLPKTLSTEIQILDLSNNPLYEITRRAFEEAQLNNLKKLFLRDCKLQTIHKHGLSGLAIMIELDLSKNNLKDLHSETFKETAKIRWILLNDNQLETLDDGLFNNLPFLQKVDLSNNKIKHIGVKTFMNVPKLNNLKLDNNLLESLKIDTLSALTALTSLDVHDNPWKCDCYLQPLRNWVISKNLYTTPVACAEPAKVQGKLWKELDTNDFACRPSIVYPTASMTVQTHDTNITLSCQVNGNPLPDVSWVLNSQIIDGTYKIQGESKYYLSKSNDENSKWVNLTIISSGTTDSGEYLCVARNPGGVEERSVMLAVAHTPPGVPVPTGFDSNMLPVLIGVSCTAAILLILLVILCYCCCRRRSSDKKADTTNGEALIEGSVIPEMEKSLITAVNPVTKPPRRYDNPPSIMSGATEMSELNKTLLDNDSNVFAHPDDEKRSLDFDHQPKRSQDALNIEYGRTAYPPDLLSFPARAAQISPAASNASTVPDTTRLPPQLNPVSPIHSPIYGMTTNQNLFRTLPYSRSQSPFTAPITPPVVTPRQGYVTIPRRPRVPSWSSTASTQILPSAEAQEPLYDNLGLRTTANGSSVLSLNKTGLEPTFSPMRNRPLPATPAAYPPHQPHQVFYAPIEEQEPAPSPIPQYNPRNSVASQMSNMLSSPGPQEPMSPRMSWAAKNTSTPQPEPRKIMYNENRNSDTQSQVSDTSTLSRKKPETGSLRRPRADTEEVSSPSKEDPRKNESNVCMNQTGTLGRSGKIPPRPPPKPKKKPAAEANPTEPLFEDEGEDGTEV